jgi:hypothetical protein
MGALRAIFGMTPTYAASATLGFLLTPGRAALAPNKAITAKPIKANIPATTKEDI